MPSDPRNNSVRLRLDALAEDGRKALCQFVIAGDPAPQQSARLIRAAAEEGVDILEFCIPFRNSITDGPVIQRGYDRALEAGTTLETALAQMAVAARDIPVVCLADWRYTVKPLGLESFLDRAVDHGAGAVLIHGLPPVLSDTLTEAAHTRGLGQVATIYPNSTDEQLRKSAAAATAFLYLVSSYGRSGGAFEAAALGDTIRAARAAGAGPIGVGFGLKTPADHRAAFGAGADMTIIGSAMTGIIEAHRNAPERLEHDWRVLLSDLAAAKCAPSKKRSIA